MISYSPTNVPPYLAAMKGHSDHVQSLFHRISVHHDNLNEATNGPSAEARMHTQECTRQFDQNAAEFHAQLVACSNKALSSHIELDQNHAVSA